MNQAAGRFVIASLPAAAVGIWNLGAQLANTAFLAGDAWQAAWLRPLWNDHQPAALAAFLLGCTFFIPLLVCSLAVSRVWAEAFARIRRRPLDRGWLLTAWLFSLLLPATMPLPFAALGLSFGLVFGCHAFGGTGRYIVHPALLGVVFLTIAYPDLVAATRWLPGADVPTSWALLSAENIELDDPQAMSWWAVFLGREIGALGATSALACLIGAGYLIARAGVSARIVVAAVVGLTAAATLGGGLPGHWHMAIGNFAFALAFIATEPTTKPLTKGGGWAFGALFGVLTVVLRTANPDHPEGTWAALLLASLCVPLLDRLAALSRARLIETPGHGDG